MAEKRHAAVLELVCKRSKRPSIIHDRPCRKEEERGDGSIKRRAPRSSHYAKTPSSSMSNVEGGNPDSSMTAFEFATSPDGTSSETRVAVGLATPGNDTAIHGPLRWCTVPVRPDFVWYTTMPSWTQCDEAAAEAGRRAFPPGERLLALAKKEDEDEEEEEEEEEEDDDDTNELLAVGGSTDS